MNGSAHIFQGQDGNAVDVAVRQARCCNMDPRFEAVLFSICLLCPLASGSWLWTLVHQYDLLGTNSQSSPVDPADSPLFSGCEEMACQVYMGALESTLNRTQDPCKDLYRFVCDGWEHRCHLSVVDTTKEVVYSRAFNAILWPRLDESNREFTLSDARGVEEKMIEFARSCMHFAESILGDVKKFMADRHLPWPNASRWDLLEVLLDLSGNWNLHLWFQVIFEMAPFRGGTGEPVLRISHSTAFRTWIATMRSFAGRQVALTFARPYLHVKDMLGFFDVSESRARELAPEIEEMDRLTLGALGPAMLEHDSRTLRMAIRNLSYTATPEVAAGRPGERFFIDWMNLMNARWWLQEQDLSNVLRPGYVLNHRWSFRGTLAVAGDYFVFPLHHPDFPPTVNYGGAERLIADEVLRGLFYEPRYKHLHGHPHSHDVCSEYHSLRNDSGSGESSQDFQQHNVDTKALLAALRAYRLGVLRNSTGSKGKERSMAHDRFFFVASCYALCSSSNSVDTLYRDASSICNVPIRGLPEFQAAFHCVEPRSHD
ncbi:hypothetical protein HPB48_008026 [Haemaphysalis longicornis]|uniref:Uncharacterized protein n=1 Tax=Haemaphysalis longicornis TaxID=44386 RepID=A0A9J6G1S7_HAELO|nr:hypothetical protein HPB48_008026 [Haemaphysalis longicornis]